MPHIFAQVLVILLSFVRKKVDNEFSLVGILFDIFFMSYTCLLMVLCECACANLISKANFNLINRTDLFICLHIMFQISIRNSKAQKCYRKFFGVWSEL